MAKDDRHLHFRSMDVRLKDPYYVGTEQEKMKDRLQEVENSNTQLTQSNAELTKSNAELSRLIAELTQKVDLLTMEKEKETAKFKEDHEQMHLQIQNLFHMSVNLFC